MADSERKRPSFLDWANKALREMRTSGDEKTACLPIASLLVVPPAEAVAP